MVEIKNVVHVNKSCSPNLILRKRKKTNIWPPKLTLISVNGQFFMALPQTVSQDIKTSFHDVYCDITIY